MLEPQRPLDFLNARRGMSVKLVLNNGNAVSGELIAFDMHLNCWLRLSMSKLDVLYRGGAIQSIGDL